jgi:hypothetical protein
METVLEIVQGAAAKAHNLLHAQDIPQERLQAISRAFYQRGKDKATYLLKNAPSPSNDPWAFAAWAGIQPNRHKAASCTGSFMLYLDHEAQQFVLDLRKVRWPMALDKDAETLSGLGLM